MPKFYQVARDSAGNIVAQATVTVYEAGTSTAAAIYSDASLATPLANPFTSATDGSYEFHARPGSYKVKVEKTGFSTFEEDYLPLSARDATYNVHDYGALGDGTADDAAAIQRAIDAAEAEEDGVVLFEARNYKVNSTLRVKRAVFLRGQGAGDDPNAALGTAGTTRLVWGGSTGTGPMVQFKAASASVWLHGGGIDSMVLDGANLATEGIHLDSCQYTAAGGPGGRMLRLTQFQDQALRLSSENGQRCRFCEVYAHYRAGGNAAAAASHGLVIDCNTDAQTSHRIWLFYGVVVDGYAILVDGFADNCDFYFVGGFPTGTGGQIRFQESATTGDGPITNILHQVPGGDLEFDGNLTWGNVVHYHSSENGSIAFTNGATGHYRTHDKYHGDFFGTHVYPMDEELSVPAGMMLPSVGTVGTGLTGPWGCWNFDNGNDEGVGANLGVPRWANGVITKVRIFYSHTAGTSSVQWAGVVSLHTAQPGSVAVSPAEHISSTLAIPLDDSANRNEFYDYTLATPLAYARGDHLFVAVKRLGATSGGVDTFASILRFHGVTIFYRSTGPDGNTAGTFDVPLPYHT